ncbi:hypothetical protein ABF129_001702 [Listeria monocytogenes]
MPGMISKQPNGLYCRISTIVEAPTRWDMSKDELRRLLLSHDSMDFPNQTTEDWLSKWAVTFEFARSKLGGLNMTMEEVREWLVSVGDENADEFLKEKSYRWEEEDD